MKFVCDNCGTQYLISDEKVGPKGVKIRCKRCGNIILLRAGDPIHEPVESAGGGGPDHTTTDPAIGMDEAVGEQDELGAAFDQLLRGGLDDSAVDDDDEEEGRATEIFSMQELQRLRGEDELEDDDQDKIDQAFSQAESTGVPHTHEEEEDREEWYVAVEDEQVGPLGLPEVENRWSSGDIGPETLAWHPGMPDWTAIKDVPKLRYLLGGLDNQEVPASVENGGASSVSGEEAWAPSSGSSLSSLVEEEMESVQVPAPEEDEEAEISPEEELLEGEEGGVPPWEKEEVVSGEVARPSDSYFDSTLDQPTTGAGAHARTDRSMARPAYLSGESSPRSKKMFFIVGALAFVVVVAGVVLAVVLSKGDETDKPAGMTEPIQAPSDGDENKGEGNTTGTAAPKKGDENPGATNGKEPSKGTDVAKGSGKDEGKDKGKDKGKDEKDTMVVGQAGTGPVKKPPSTDKVGRKKKIRTPKKKKKKKKKTVSFSKDPKVKDKPDSPERPASGGSLPETLSKAEIAKTMKKFVPAMKGCVQQQQQRDPSVTGTMLVSFTIQGKGKVELVRILSADHKGTYVAGCITYIIKSMKFPRFRGAPITVPRVPLRLGG